MPKIGWNAVSIFLRNLWSSEDSGIYEGRRPILDRSCEIGFRRRRDARERKETRTHPTGLQAIWCHLYGYVPDGPRVESKIKKVVRPGGLDTAQCVLICCFIALALQSRT